MLVFAAWQPRAAVGSAGEGLGHAAALLGAQPGQERHKKGSEAVAAGLVRVESRAEPCLLLGDSFHLRSSIGLHSSFLSVC